MRAEVLLSCRPMAELRFSVPGRPVPFSRAGRNGKRSYTPAKQRDAMAAIAAAARQARGCGRPLAGPLEIRLSAVYAVPPSWNRARRSAAFWHTSRPDVDNIAKLALDALSGVAYGDDATVVRITADKTYGDAYGVHVVIGELDAEPARPSPANPRSGVNG